MKYKFVYFTLYYTNFQSKYLSMSYPKYIDNFKHNNESNDKIENENIIKNTNKKDYDNQISETYDKEHQIEKENERMK